MRAVTWDGWNLTGLTAGPGQRWGAVRLVPLLRDAPITDLRLHARLHDPDDPTVAVPDPRTGHVAYVPHAFVASWTSDGGPVAAYGTQLTDPARGRPAGVGLHLPRRTTRRKERNRLRFLPLHLALEGYLALHCGGPSVVWEEWNRRAVNRGLSPWAGQAYTGAEVAGLADALRVFEIHPGQCGMLLYVADALAAALVVPHPDDYRVLHPTLLLDLFGELVYHHAHLYPAVAEFHVEIDAERVTRVADLRAEAARIRAAWSAFALSMAEGLFGARPTTSTPVYRMGRFTLARFLPDFDPRQENHIGETITDEAGRLAYLKTFRLSAAQVRRGYLLSRLAAHDWNLDATAGALGTDRESLVRRLDRAGFGNLLRPEIIDAARRAARERDRRLRLSR